MKEGKLLTKKKKSFNIFLVSIYRYKGILKNEKYEHIKS